MLKMQRIWYFVYLVLFTTRESILETTVISSPGVVWSSDNSAVQLVWRHSRDEILRGDLRIDKENTRIIEFVRYIGITTLHPNYTDRVTVYDTNEGGIYAAGVTISPLSLYDYGTYCSILFAADPACDASVVVLGVPSDTDLTGESPVQVEDDINLRCSAVATTLPSQYAPVMTYMWNINGTTYSPGDDAGLPERHSFRDADGQLNKELVLTSLERDDIYQYTCHARENGSSFMSEQSNAYSLLPYFSPGSAKPAEDLVATNSSSDVTLTCTAIELGRPRGIWLWSKPGGKHEDTGTSGDLVIRNASVTADDGIYSCYLANPAGNGSAGNITVTVNEKPTITEIGEVIVINTNPLNVSCEVKARPGASIVWKYDDGGDLPGQIFRYFDHVTSVEKYTTSTSYLVWSTGGQSDDRRGLGKRTIVCKAANAAGTARNKFDLDIQYAAYGVQMKPPPPEEIVEYESLGPVLCSASCNPLCTYSWYKGGDEVSFNATLMIHNVTRDDNGVYECRPDNTLTGGDTSKFNLSVYYGPDIDTFTIGSPNDPILEGDPVRFTCDTDSRPTPVITMYTPRGDVLASSSQNQSLGHTRPDINCLDSGQYKCQAFNSETQKCHIKKEYALIHCAPRKNRTSAREVAATDGDTVSFNITTVAYPQPEFTWFFNGTELSDVSHTIETHTMAWWEPDVFNSSNLTLSNITQENFGNYNVIANNTQGAMENIVFLLIAVGVPERPREFCASRANAVSITMQWTSGWKRGAEQVFTLMYRRSDNDDSYTNITDISDPGQGETVTSKAVGLLPDTSYDLKVLAANQHGASQSQLVTHSTEVEPNIGSESSGSFSIVVTGGVATITWSLYKYSGPITHVDVNSCEISLAQCLGTTVDKITKELEVAVPEGGSSYTFEFLVYDGEDLILTVIHRAKVDGGLPVGVIVGVLVTVVVLVVAAVVVFLLWRRKTHAGIRKDNNLASELGYVNPVMVTDDDISLSANGKHDTMSEGHQMVVENTLYASSGPGGGDHMDQPYCEVPKAAGKKKTKGRKGKQNAVEMNNRHLELDSSNGKLPMEDTISPYVDGTDKPKGVGNVDSQLPMYAEVDRSQKPKKAKSHINEPEVVEYEEVDFKKKSSGVPAAGAGVGVAMGAAALPEYGQVDLSKKRKQGKAAEPPQLEEYAQVDFSKKNGKEAAGKGKPPVKGKKPKPGAPPPRPPRAASVDEGKQTQRPPDCQPQYGVEGTLYADLDLINTRPTCTEPTVHANLEPSEYASIDALCLTTRPADQ